MDSDDEYNDRKRREKFKRERSDFDKTGNKEFSSGWDKGEKRRRTDGFQDYGNRRRYSPEPRQDQKRFRGGNYNYYNNRPYQSQGGGDGWGGGGNWQIGGGMGGGSGGNDGFWNDNYQEKRHRPNEDAPYLSQPLMMSFKSFLQSQDDSISDNEAVQKYNEYKRDFKKLQLCEFFKKHKDEDWFKLKYHPDEYKKRCDEKINSIKIRWKAFNRLFEKGWLEDLHVELSYESRLSKYLDAAVIYMEGGTEVDISILENRVCAVSGNQVKETEKSKSSTEYGEVISDVEEGEDVGGSADLPPITISEKIEHAPIPEAKAEEDELTNIEPVPDQDTVELQEVDKVKTEEEGVIEEKVPVDVPKKEAKTERKRPIKDADDISESGSSDSETSSSDSEKEPEPKPPGVEDLTEKSVEIKQIIPEEPKPRALHRTLSLFMRNLSPVITKAEIVNLCSSGKGFLRVAISDPQPDRKFFRRGWVTFDNSVNIKEICWNLNSIKLNDCELCPVVNRDLTRRIRPIHGIVNHRLIVREDIRNVAKLVQILDRLAGLWMSEEMKPGETDEPPSMQFFKSANPLMENITEYLIEEEAAEEEELLGVGITSAMKEEESNEADPAVLKVLDRLLLYLRVVHSVDYYNAAEYPNEDDMPNRCGIMHARGPLLPGKIEMSEVEEWMKHFEQKIKCLFDSKKVIGESDLDEIGIKTEVDEIEKFIEENTQEMGKDKWLCPISGKKFKGPEFVRKHIYNKQQEKLEEVKKDVEYFNNYLRDARRPQLPEHPRNRISKDMSKDDNPMQQQQHHLQQHQHAPLPHIMPPQMMAPPWTQIPMMGWPTGRGGWGGSVGGSRGGFDQGFFRGGSGSFRGGSRGGRSLIQYKDLDAVDESEIV